jgi:hypothetical protein
MHYDFIVYFSIVRLIYFDLNKILRLNQNPMFQPSQWKIWLSEEQISSILFIIADTFRFHLNTSILAQQSVKIIFLEWLSVFSYLCNCFKIFLHLIHSRLVLSFEFPFFFLLSLDCFCCLKKKNNQSLKHHSLSAIMSIGNNLLTVLSNTFFSLFVTIKSSHN